jgi:hypothetical protein
MEDITMKKKKIGKKLVLNKESIASLNPTLMVSVKGGLSLLEDETCFGCTYIECETLVFTCQTDAICTLGPIYCEPLITTPQQTCQN